MSERDESSTEEPIYRCPSCDSVVAADAERCLMCGAVQPERPLSIPLPPADPEPEPEPVVEPQVESEEEPSAEQPHLLEEAPQPEEVEDVQAAVPSAPVFVHVEDPEYAVSKKTKNGPMPARR